MYATYLRLDILVWDSDRAVIRAARSKLSRSALRDPGKREVRKCFYREMLATTPMRNGSSRAAASDASTIRILQPHRPAIAPGILVSGA